MLEKYFGLLIPKLNAQQETSKAAAATAPPTIITATSALKKTNLREPAAACDFVSATNSLCVAVRTMHAHKDSIESLLVRFQSLTYT